VPAAPVRRYQNLIDEDYKVNKITVCAHLLNIYNSFVVSQGRNSTINYFDIDKWNTYQTSLTNKKWKTGKPKAPPLPRDISLTFDVQMDRAPQNCLLTKTHSTKHLPLNNKHKDARRAYANFDKELASRMFGYRVDFNRQRVKSPDQEPTASQRHKPLTKYVADVVAELGAGYVSMKYATK
jgi:hypothetical protein